MDRLRQNFDPHFLPGPPPFVPLLKSGHRPGRKVASAPWSFSNFRFPIYSISDFRIELGFAIGFVIGDGFIAGHKNGDQFVVFIDKWREFILTKP